MAILSNLAYQPIAYGVPNNDAAEAKSLYTGPLDWSANVTYTLDPTQSNQQLEMQNIQSVFIDNPGTGTLTITVTGTWQILRVPPKSQAFLPLIASDRPVVTFANTSGNGSSQVWLLNIPVSGLMWTLP
jgi:hypothetical protein